MGVADNRDGVSLMQRSREKDLVLPSEIMNLEDLEAYLKIANYSITKIRFKYKRYPESQEPFMVRDDLMLENIVAEQLAIAEKARLAAASGSMHESRDREQAGERRAEEAGAAMEMEENS